MCISLILLISQDYLLISQFQLLTRRLSSFVFGRFFSRYDNNAEFMDQVHTQTSLARDIEEVTGVLQTWHSDVNFTTRMMVER
jgi:hypothetical protein